MLATGHLLAFLATVYVLILVPGPSVIFTVSRGVALGRRAALITVLGNTSGLFCQLVLVVVGLGALLASSDALFTGLRLAGAAYLILLGLRSFRDRGERSPRAARASGSDARRSGSSGSVAAAAWRW
jgi:threonine/homoserine/homoserine lactone efflux protein